MAHKVSNHTKKFLRCKSLGVPPQNCEVILISYNKVLKEAWSSQGNKELKWLTGHYKLKKMCSLLITKIMQK